jgi:hypothetical protein
MFESYLVIEEAIYHVTEKLRIVFSGCILLCGILYYGSREFGMCVGVGGTVSALKVQQVCSFEMVVSNCHNPEDDILSLNRSENLK